MTTKTATPTQAKVGSMLSLAGSDAIAAKTALEELDWALREAGIDNAVSVKAIEAINEVITFLLDETAKAGITF